MKLAALLPAAALFFAAIAAQAQTADKPAEPAASTESPSGDDAPVRRYPPTITRLEVATAGLVLIGGAWGAGFACATAWPTQGVGTLINATTGLPETNPKTGAVLTGPVYGPPGSAQLKIPIVGPWIALGKSGCAQDDPGCGAKIGVRAALYVIQGLVELGGLGLVAEAIFMKTESGKPAPKAAFLGLRYGDVAVQPAPILMPTMSGIGFVGSF